MFLGWDYLNRTMVAGSVNGGCAMEIELKFAVQAGTEGGVYVGTEYSLVNGEYVAGQYIPWKPGNETTITVVVPSEERVGQYL